VVAVAAALLGVLGVVDAVRLLVAGEWFEAVVGVLTVVGMYWFAAGAWYRTPWGHSAERIPPPEPPTLTADRARTYIALGATCVAACLIALATQALMGSW
jgi:hypothetical protein